GAAGRRAAPVGRSRGGAADVPACGRAGSERLEPVARPRLREQGRRAPRGGPAGARAQPAEPRDRAGPAEPRPRQRLNPSRTGREAYHARRERALLRRDPLANPEPLLRRVYSYVAYWLGDGPDAEDVTSEVLENALRYRASYDPSKGEPVAWLLGIARRSVQRALANRPPAPVEPPEVEAPGNLESDAIQRLSLDAAVAELSERDRELIALRYGADLKVRQIAELLDQTTNSVEVALYRALARLRTHLEVQEQGAAR